MATMPNAAAGLRMLTMFCGFKKAGETNEEKKIIRRRKT
jgi:hypothetical protein